MGRREVWDCACLQFGKHAEKHLFSSAVYILKEILCGPTSAVYWVWKGRKRSEKTRERGIWGERWKWSLFSGVLLPYTSSHFLFHPVKPFFFLRNDSWGILCQERRSACRPNLCWQLRSVLKILQKKWDFPGNHRLSRDAEVFSSGRTDVWGSDERLPGVEDMSVQRVDGALQSKRLHSSVFFILGKREERVAILGTLALMPNQIRAWFWVQRPPDSMWLPSWYWTLLPSRTVVVSRLPVKIIPPVVFAPKLVSGLVWKSWAKTGTS